MKQIQLIKSYVKVKVITKQVVFFTVFSLLLKKICLTINELGKIQQLMTFEVFNDSKRLLHRSQYFNMLEGEKISALLPRSLKKQFNNGIIIPVKMRRCKACKDGIL